MQDSSFLEAQGTMRNSHNEHECGNWHAKLTLRLQHPHTGHIGIKAHEANTHVWNFCKHVVVMWDRGHRRMLLLDYYGIPHAMVFLFAGSCVGSEWQCQHILQFALLAVSLTTLPEDISWRLYLTSSHKPLCNNLHADDSTASWLQLGVEFGCVWQLRVQTWRPFWCSVDDVDAWVMKLVRVNFRHFQEPKAKGCILTY